MSVLVVGLSHKSAPVAILEQAAVSGDPLAKLLRDVALADPGPRADPLIARVHQLLEIGIGEPFLGKVVSRAANARAIKGFAHCYC